MQSLKSKIVIPSEKSRKKSFSYCDICFLASEFWGFGLSCVGCPQSRRVKKSSYPVYVRDARHVA